MKGNFVKFNWSGVVPLLCVVALAALALGLTSSPVHAVEQPQGDNSDAPYAMELSALTGPQGADITLVVAAAPGYGAVKALKKVQLKTFAADGSLTDVRNLKDVSAPGGVANIELGQLERGRRVEADAHIQTGAPKRTYVLRGDTITRLRPDLVVSTVQAPLQTLTTRPVDLIAEVAELNGDTAANATVTLLWGPLRARNEVGDRARRRQGLGRVRRPSADQRRTRRALGRGRRGHAVRDRRDQQPPDRHRRRQRARARPVTPARSGLGGYGAQFNQHVYAAITSAPPGSLPDLEAKVKALEPQLVRIFFNHAQEADPDKMASFVETVALAQEAGATINITYQSPRRR